jgi:hypothetical protein
MPVFPSPALTAKDAIARHVQWRITMETAIVLREALTQEQMAQAREHQHCLIGRWLASDATLGRRQYPEYCALVAYHTDFHRHLERIARLLAARRFEQAALAIRADSPFMEASNLLANAITGFDRMVSIRLAAV